MWLSSPESSVSVDRPPTFGFDGIEPAEMTWLRWGSDHVALIIIRRSSASLCRTFSSTRARRILDGVVRRVFDSAFQQYGLPAAIRSDNGPPFASTGPASLTTLSVWWLRLGIRTERIEPGKPQQNGPAGTLPPDAQVRCRAAESLRLQQRAYDLYRAEYNQERPHEALGGRHRPPSTVGRRADTRGDSSVPNRPHSR
jgi:transposase InsO family protein